MKPESYILPEWPLSDRVNALVTTRLGGVSSGVWGQLNLGTNTQDHPTSVEENRKLLTQHVGLGKQPFWLKQVHGIRVVTPDESSTKAEEADACYTDMQGSICTVLTADCLPVFLGSEDGSEVAVAHAGWRGLAAGVITETLKRFRSSPGDIHAWLGPAISADHYEVGDDLRVAFSESSEFSALPVDQAFYPRPGGKWSADLYELARMQLRSLGVRSISGGDRCTYAESDLFYSYRRDGETGRFASLIWLK